MKYLGQHFLKNKSAIKKIVGALEPASGEIIVEIGPGHGELTSELLALSFELLGNGVDIKIIAIEKDRDLAESLRKKFAAEKNIEIVEGDALKVLPQLVKSYNLKAKSYTLVGNIPYYITGRLLRIVGNLENKPMKCIFTVQKEVAERICAAPRMNPVRSRTPRGSSGACLRAGATSNRMNRFAASVQFWSRPEIIGYISKTDFRPEPKVDSAIITLTRNDADYTRTDAERYYATVRKLFAQPRKTILNNLSGKNSADKEKLAEKIRKIGADPDGRPQDLGIVEIMKLAEII